MKKRKQLTTVWDSAKMAAINWKRPEFIVRTMRKSDLRFLLGIEKMASSAPWTQKDFRDVDASEMDYCLVAVLPGQFEDEVVGHVVVRCDRESEVLLFLKIGVNPEWQRCGIASGLVHITRKHAGFYKSERAFCEKVSEPHQNFWLKMGFQKDRVVDDGIVFARRK